MQGSTLLRLLLFTLLCQLGFADDKCYFPDGSEATSDVRCQDGPNSACCGKDAICLSNGLCLDTVQPFGLSRASCSDRSWSIDECSPVCNNISLSNGCSVVLKNVTKTGFEYCCNSIVNNPHGPEPICAQNASTITLKSADIMAGHAALSNYKRADGNRDVAIGAGVGVSLGVIAILAIVWAVFERIKRFKTFRSPAGAGVAGNPYVADYHAAAKSTAPNAVYSHAHGPAEMLADTTQPVELEGQPHYGFGR